MSRPVPPSLTVSPARPSSGSGGAHPWNVVRYARLRERPGTGVYLALAFEAFFELHGDRRYRDDPSIRGGIAWLNRRPLVVLGHERGGDGEQARCNFGMPFPEGYHKAMRLMCLAEHFHLPVVTLVDTPGAYPGLGAEERGQAGAIATILQCMAGLQVPTVSVIIGQGGSGGALALALSDRVLMLQYATYSVISPEGCASILWHTSDRAVEAAAALRLTAQDLLELDVIDEVIAEPEAGIASAHREAALRLRNAVARQLRALRGIPPAELLRRREAKYARIGVFRRAGCAPTAAEPFPRFDRRASEVAPTRGRQAGRDGRRQTREIGARCTRG